MPASWCPPDGVLGCNRCKVAGSTASNHPFSGLAVRASLPDSFAEARVLSHVAAPSAAFIQPLEGLLSRGGWLLVAARPGFPQKKATSGAGGLPEIMMIVETFCCVVLAAANVAAILCIFIKETER